MVPGSVREDMARCCSQHVKGRISPLLPTCRTGVTQGRALHGTAAAGIAEKDKKMKTFDDLPGPSLITNLYWFFLRGYLLHTHELQIKYRHYGPMFRSVIGPYKMVNIMDPEIMEVVLRQEGKYPMRTDMDIWKDHRNQRNLSYGPFTEEGHRWHTLRTTLNKKMLKPSEAKMYVGSINEVVSDLMERIQELRRGSPSGNTVSDIANVFYRFAFEGVSYILFETRIGCMNEQIPPETQKFIDSIGFMLKNSVYVTYLPPWTRKVLPYWKHYMKGWDDIFDYSKKLVDKKMSEIQQRLERGEEVQGEYLTYLLSSGKLSVAEVYGSVCELLLAGMDTTSNTLSWSLYHLAQDSELQQSLYDEVTDSVPADRIPAADDIARMPKLRAVIKETLRLYPVVPINARIINEKEVIIGDYQFPKNTQFVLNHYSMSRDEKNFEQPEKFLPRRWLRDGGMKHHAFSSIPFGYGVRACVGRRIAELEMYLALARIIKTFVVHYNSQEEEIKPMDIFKKKYGPIWKTTLGRYKNVTVSDVDLLESLLRQEGKYPVRLDMELWKIHRRQRNLGLGPFTEVGQRWHNMRSVLNKRMLKPKEAVLYTDVINEVVTDFLEMLDNIRKTSPSGVTVNNIQSNFYRFSFEGVSYILFESRLGCLQEIIPPETKKFIDSIGDMMKYSVHLSFLPTWTNYILPYWRRYIQSWDYIFDFGNKLIDQKMQNIQERLERGEEVQGEYLTYLLSSNKLTVKEIYGSVAELLLAGVDTTANTLSWVMFHLSRNIDVQNALYQEVTSAVPGDAALTGDDIAKMPLLRAVIKETLRMYPVVPINSRIAVEDDMIIGDYFFPKGTLFTLNHYQISRDEKNFPQANSFLPQRWLRGHRTKNNSFSSIPFGYGVRACVGRRLAELEMYLLISRILKKYELRPDSGPEEMKSVLRVGLAPQEPINLQFLERRPDQ